MTFDLAKIPESKRKFRQRLAVRPFEERLAMLHALRERALAIRAAQTASHGGALREVPPPYGVQGTKSG